MQNQKVAEIVIQNKPEWNKNAIIGREKERRTKV